MDRDELAGRIDHTVLGPATTWRDVRRVLDEAREHGMNACVPPCYVSEATDYAPEVTIATVIAFPHGQQAPGLKRAEARGAQGDGADELDLVLNVGRLKAGEDDAVRDEVAAVVDAVPLPVKVIVEAPLLSDAEKHRAGDLVADAGAAMLKTATGFADGGATVDDVALLSEYLPVKASGGIGTWDRAAAMLSAGAERIGASSGVAILEDFEG